VGEVLTGNGGIIVQVIAVETESTDGGTEIGDKGIEMVGNIAYQKFFLYPVGSPAGPRLTAGDLHPYHGMAGSASLYITVGITVDDAPAHFSGNPLYIGQKFAVEGQYAVGGKLEYKLRMGILGKDSAQHGYVVMDFGAVAVGTVTYGKVQTHGL
jgi:hypothetical protein